MIDRINSEIAKAETELSLPKELNSEQQIELARDYCRKFFISAGMCADLCIHDKVDGNPHAHIMLTMRLLEPDGSWAAKCKKEYILNENGERIQLKSGEYDSRKVDVVDWNDQSKPISGARAGLNFATNIWQNRTWLSASTAAPMSGRV